MIRFCGAAPLWQDRLWPKADVSCVLGCLTVPEFDSEAVPWRLDRQYQLTRGTRRETFEQIGSTAGAASREAVAGVFFDIAAPCAG